MKDSFKNLIEKFTCDKKRLFIIVAGIVGVLLLVVSEFIPESEEDVEITENDDEMSFTSYEKDIEERLKNLIESIDGAGKVQVMVTIESGDEKVYATESKKTENNEEKNYVLVDIEGSDSGLLLKIAQPEIRGVAIVCQGADSPTVRNAVVGAVTSVLGISSNRVNVSKMKNSNGG
ncbi:MAG: hypothetical protein U0K91_03075 [Acutalibacteraceae bacterium]|nr:hypothetical protein [Acutalibacteraceae bacterium]